MRSSGFAVSWPWQPPSFFKSAVSARSKGQVARRGLLGAAVEHSTESSQREAELERKLAVAEQQIAELRAQASKSAAPARKTLPAATTQLLAKGGITSLESIEAGALDAALAGLSLEQRIAVKAQLIRAGSLA